LEVLLLWLVTTTAVAVAVPAVWLQRNVIDGDGYAALAQRAAADPSLQIAVAAELATRVTALIKENGDDVDPQRVHAVTTTYTSEPQFPRQFAHANRSAHDWLFTGANSSVRQHGWVVDLAPMLRDSVFDQMFSTHGVKLPEKVVVEVAAPDELRAGGLRPLTTLGRWLCLGALALTGICGLVALIVARRRGRVLAGLGVSLLLVGAGGYAAAEAGHGVVDDALGHTTGHLRQIADVMVAYAQGSLHEWLNLSLAAGGALVVSGIFMTMVTAR
jgi:hypothetical protein